MNLFTFHNDWRGQGITMDSGLLPPFQIDANFGFVAAAMEMLVFSAPGVLKLLPSLPQRWTRGRVDGLRARGGIQVTMKWNRTGGQLEASLRSTRTQTVNVALPSWAGTPRISGAAAGSAPHGWIRVSLSRGRSARIRCSRSG